MDHIKKGSDGREHVERVDVDPRVPSIEEMDRKNHGLAGPNEYVKTYLDTHETDTQRHKRAPKEGHMAVEVDETFQMRLPDHPRGEGWIEPDPSKSILPEDRK